MKDGIIYQSNIKHMCVSVAGALRQGARKLNGFFEDEHGRPFSGKYAVELLKKYQFEGKRVIPMGECDLFDYDTGCPGHPIVTVVEDWLFETGNG